jgi:hypothetical protein
VTMVGRNVPHGSRTGSQIRSRVAALIEHRGWTTRPQRGEPRLRLVPLAIAIVTWALAVMSAQEFSDNRLSHPAIRYDQPTDDPVAELLRQRQVLARVESDESSPRLLETLLGALSVPVDSQMLVFSKGSFQSTRIHAGNPRALYFNDAVSVGWVRGGLIEIASQDPVRGTVFYVVQPGARPLMRRADAQCLSCHFGPRTNGVPGMIEPIGHKRPLEERWGGWYVTGRLGNVSHFGNVDVATFLRNPEVRATELLSLEKTFDTGGYLAPHSDVAALLVFEHQMQMTNLLTRLGWETRIATQEERLAQRRSEIRETVEQVVDYLMFVDEAPIPARIEGSTKFATQFSARGPRDARGRSLYQLDLATRLLRHRCSYMIYSEQFNRLSQPARDAVYARLWEVLSGAGNDPRYRHLSRADRQAIVDILRDTKPDLPSYFRTVER